MVQAVTAVKDPCMDCHLVHVKDMKIKKWCILLQCGSAFKVRSKWHSPASIVVDVRFVFNAFCSLETDPM